MFYYHSEINFQIMKKIVGGQFNSEYVSICPQIDQYRHVSM
jgi:hypothetical protein